MTGEQIKEYLDKYSLNTKDLLANHIIHLKRNTKPNTELISELSYVLLDEEKVFFSVLPTKINSTRHKSRGRDTHSVLFDLERVKSCPKGGLQCFCDGSCHEKRSLDYSAPTNSITSEWVRNNTGGIVGDLEGINRPPTTEQLNYQSFYQVVYTKPTSNWNKFEITFSDNDLEKIKDLSIGDIKEMFNSTISAEKTEKEENTVFSKDSEIHKEDNVDLIIAEALHRLGKKHLEDKNHETFIVGEGVKESPTTEAYKETEGKLFYELDWGFITQMAERMSSNKKEGKYSLWNWKKPMTPKGLEDLKQATFRHLLEVLDGKYEDDGRPFGHIEAISDNMMMINYQLKNNER